MPKNTTPVNPKYDVRIHSIRPEGSCKATASVTICGIFAARGIKVMDGSKGLFVSMPSYKAGNGEYKDICFPCTKEEKAEFDKTVIGAYRHALTQGQETAQKLEAPDFPQEQGQPVMGGM